MIVVIAVFFFKQKTAYEMRISDWSSDVCSSDLASEALLDAESIKRFRSRYREIFGATATGDPLYQAISDGRRLAGLEHLLPLFEDKLVTLFDHLGEDAVYVRDHGVAGERKSTRLHSSH